MLTNDLFSSLVYLDRDFIAGRYEIATGVSAHSQITKSQSKKAGASIPVFSAEVSAVETRTFPVSTLEMLALTMSSLQAAPTLNPTTFRPGMQSTIGWLDATLGTVTAIPSTGIPGTDSYERGEEQGCFTLRGSARLLLITTPDYFVSGLDALLKMHKLLVRDLTMPVRALVRVLAAQSYTDDWIAVPYLIQERPAT